MPDGLLEIGRIGRAHGIKGDVFVDLSTDRTERMAVGGRVWEGRRWLTIAAASPSNKGWRVHFEGIDDRNAAEAMARRVLFAEPIDDPDVLWVHELIGSEVIETDGTNRGRCVSVLDNPASDLLELESGALVPIRFVTSVDAGVVTIEPPEGLFDVFDVEV